MKRMVAIRLPLLHTLSLPACGVSAPTHNRANMPPVTAAAPQGEEAKQRLSFMMRMKFGFIISGMP